jgi:hypothetical protein
VLFVLGFQADDDTVGYGECFSVGAVSFQQAHDALFHPIGFRAAQLELKGQVNGELQQLVVIHRLTPPSQNW